MREYLANVHACGFTESMDGKLAEDTRQELQRVLDATRARYADSQGSMDKSQELTARSAEVDARRQWLEKAQASQQGSSAVDSAAATGSKTTEETIKPTWSKVSTKFGATARRDNFDPATVASAQAADREFAASASRTVPDFNTVTKLPQDSRPESGRSTQRAQQPAAAGGSSYYPQSFDPKHKAQLAGRRDPMPGKYNAVSGHFEPAKNTRAVHANAKGDEERYQMDGRPIHVPGNPSNTQNERVGRQGKFRNLIPGGRSGIPQG